jgi:hypothetical protein
MKKRDFGIWFNEQVKPRWPNWEVNRCLLDDWYTALGGHNAATLLEAVRRHKIRDDPSRPRISRVLALAREITASSMRRAPRAEPARDVVTAEQFWRQVRTTFSRKQRIELMAQQSKFDPHARDKDPQAYDWLMQQRCSRGGAAFESAT